MTHTFPSLSCRPIFLLNIFFKGVGGLQGFSYVYVSEWFQGMPPLSLSQVKLSNSTVTWRIYHITIHNYREDKLQDTNPALIDLIFSIKQTIISRTYKVNQFKSKWTFFIHFSWMSHFLKQFGVMNLLFPKKLWCLYIVIYLSYYLIVYCFH